MAHLSRMGHGAQGPPVHTDAANLWGPTNHKVLELQPTVMTATPLDDVFVYKNLWEDEIRLLRLYQGDWASELKGSLETYRLAVDEDNVAAQQHTIHRNGHDVPLAKPYEALSYLWGTGDEVASIQITEDSQPYYLPIKLNLRDALKTFRSELPAGASKLLWIDAICINQGDNEENEEKSAQIRKMADIYGQATNVRVWLGMQTADSDTAFTFIRRLLKLDDIDGLARRPASDVEWAAFRSLMQRPWFKRRWIVQEIAFATEATVHCGSSWVRWRDFANAVSLFSLKHADLKDLFQSSENYHNNPDYLGEIDALGAKTLVEIVNILFRRTEYGEVTEHLLSLEALMSILTAFDAKIPHDTVYSILWLSHDAKPGSRRFSTAQHRDAFYFPASPMYEPEDPMNRVAPEAFTLGGDVPHTQSPLEEVRPEPHLSTRAPTDSVFSRGTGSQNLPAVPSSTLLQVPGQGPGLSMASRSRMNSAASISRRKAEHDPETGDAKPPIEIIVDYKKSIFELGKDFLEFVIGRSRSLDMICRPWAPSPEKGKPEPEMPSWIPHIVGRPYGVRKRTTDEVFCRTAADPLVGTPGSGARKYNACGRTRAYRRKTGDAELPASYIHDRRLLTYGFVLDEIEEIEDVAHDAVIPKSWPELWGWVKRSEEPPEAFWRTLVADRGSEGPDAAPGYFQLACAWAFGKPDENANLNTGDMLKNVHGKCNSIAAAFLRRVQAVVWNRRLFVTKHHPEFVDNEELLGLAPQRAKTGDLICILYGCSVPVVLRKKQQGATRGRTKRNMPKRATQSDPPSSLYTVGRTKQKPISELAAENTTTPAVSPPRSPPPLYHAATVGAVADPRPEQSRTPASSAGRPALSLAVNQPDVEYILVGECYVHGMMDGAAFGRRLDGPKYAEQEFWLV